MYGDGQMKRGITILYWILTILPLVISIAILPILPDQIPAHYGINGEVDRWGSKWEIFILPIMSIFIGGIFYPIMTLQMKEQQQKSNTTAMSVVLLSLPLVFLTLFLFFTFSSIQKVENIADIPVMKGMATILALSFAALGYIMPKIKMNVVFGIRTPWTLKNEEVWEKTHQFGGKLMFIGGICLALICLLVSNVIAMIALLVGITLICILLIIYSYRVYKKIILK